MKTLYLFIHLFIYEFKDVANNLDALLIIVF